MHGLHNGQEAHHCAQLIADLVVRRLATTQDELPSLPEPKPLSERAFSQQAEQTRRHHLRVGRLIASRIRKLRSARTKRTEAFRLIGSNFGYSAFEAEVLVKHWSQAVWKRVERMRDVLVRNWLALHWTPGQIAARLNISVQHARRLISEIQYLDFEKEDELAQA